MFIEKRNVHFQTSLSSIQTSKLNNLGERRRQVRNRSGFRGLPRPRDQVALDDLEDLNDLDDFYDLDDFDD